MLFSPHFLAIASPTIAQRSHLSYCLDGWGHLYRENKIKDALKRFKEVKFSAQLPSFMKGYEEYDSIRRLGNELQSLVKAISEKVDADIVGKRLLADRLIEDIFSRAIIIETTAEIFSAANMRLTIGNPPGKSGSIGDAINWTILLQTVPDGEPLHVISEDGDFYSTLNEDAVHPFLEDEWRTRKQSTLHVYRTLSRFMKLHFDGVAFPFDRTKDTLIDDLSASGSFAHSHHLIAKLEAFSYFSLKEVERILAAAIENNQFGWIATDSDVSDFLNRVAVPRMASITSPEQKEVLQGVIDEQLAEQHVMPNPSVNRTLSGLRPPRAGYPRTCSGNTARPRNSHRRPLWVDSSILYFMVVVPIVSITGSEGTMGAGRRKSYCQRERPPHAIGKSYQAYHSQRKESDVQGEGPDRAPLRRCGVQRIETHCEP